MNHFTNCVAPTFLFPDTGTSLTDTITNNRGCSQCDKMTPGSSWAWAGRALLSLETPGEKDRRNQDPVHGPGPFYWGRMASGLFLFWVCWKQRGDGHFHASPLRLALGTLSDAKNVSLFRVTLEDPKVGGLWLQKWWTVFCLFHGAEEKQASLS